MGLERTAGPHPRDHQSADLAKIKALQANPLNPTSDTASMKESRILPIIFCMTSLNVLSAAITIALA